MNFKANQKTLIQLQPYNYDSVIASAFVLVCNIILYILFSQNPIHHCTITTVVQA